MSTPDSERKPLWLYPNLLNLDAPLVAVSWLYIFSQSWRMYIPWSAYLALGLTVWSIYALDRLLDSAMLSVDSPALEPRHHFHQRHRRSFRIGITCALTTATILLFTSLPMAMFKHLFFGGVMVAGFFGLSMITSQEGQQIPLTKNVLAGITFAFGTAVTAHVYRSELGIYELLGSREFLSFACLCAIQITAIDVWRHSEFSVNQEEQSGHDIMLTVPLGILAVLTLAYALADQAPAARTHHYAVLTAGALLYVLNRCRHRLPYLALGGLADLAMIIPIFVVIAASR